MTQPTKSLSPFDEALERQKQPLLISTTDHVQKNSISNMTADINCTFMSHFVRYIPSLPSPLNYRDILNTTHPSSDILPFWSTKYREEETYHDDEDETMMVEAIDFVRLSGTNKNDALMQECDSVHQHHSMHSTSTAEVISSDVINYHPSTEQYLQRQQHLQRRTHTIYTITSIVAIITISVVFILFIGTFIFV